ncbi:putative amino acid uptake ABC transporter, periplasmic amino acid-binding domain protein [Burkholderia thailandensis]|uniref:Amino acid uptake ABC transporter, periplasmic amino acid-binding domain protein n=1 Tax=Burkholderia thailandensis TaxID=57975 RepID=A0AAW9D6K7_BURTH|nr:putative amino acid uptake ABC transporter, periplasmic amino acid-binding domain protein [Burkholderia thailandensis]MDW9257372.1 putative amino acid uptake ABC transporter, periplasmic amino acid-binding domain protein [Burkholderia thailandensis]
MAGIVGAEWSSRGIAGSACDGRRATGDGRRSGEGARGRPRFFVTARRAASAGRLQQEQQKGACDAHAQGSATARRTRPAPIHRRT